MHQFETLTNYEDPTNLVDKVVRKIGACNLLEPQSSGQNQAKLPIMVKNAGMISIWAQFSHEFNVQKIIKMKNVSL